MPYPVVIYHISSSLYPIVVIWIVVYPVVYHMDPYDIIVVYPYDIQHCIYCGKSFEDVDEVILHIKSKHMVIGSG